MNFWRAKLSRTACSKSLFRGCQSVTGGDSNWHRSCDFRGVMKTSRNVATATIFSVLILGCGRDGLQREKKNYEVIEEGSAAGVTSTLHGPGETPPPAPLTGTNADTTTAFALGTTVTDTTSTAGTLAGTLPPPMTSGSGIPYGQTPVPPTRRPTPPPRSSEPETPSPTEPPVTETAAEPQPETATTPPPTTETTPPPTTETKEPERKDEEPESKPETPPPPPPVL